MAGKELEPYADARSSYAPVACSSSTSFLEERAIARRWTDVETRSRIAASPKFRFDRPSDALLDRLVQQYASITGDQVRRPKKKNLLAACYRVHGADVIPYIADEFALRSTAQNLLGIIRSSIPRGTQAIPHPAEGRSDDHDGPPCPIEHCLPGLIYCDHHYRFDPHSKRRYDKRPSNPDAACYFGDEARSPTDDAATAEGTGAR